MKSGGLWPGAPAVTLAGYEPDLGISLLTTLVLLLCEFDRLHQPGLTPGNLVWLHQIPRDGATYCACGVARAALLSLLRQWRLLYRVRGFQWGLRPNDLIGVDDLPTGNNELANVSSVSEQRAFNLDRVIELLARQAETEATIATPAPVTPPTDALRHSPALAASSPGESGAALVGRLFRERFKNDPEMRARNRRERFNSPEGQKAIKEFVDAYNAAHECDLGMLEALHLGRPDEIEEWEHIARIIELPYEVIQSGKYTYRDVID